MSARVARWFRPWALAGAAAVTATIVGLEGAPAALNSDTAAQKSATDCADPVCGSKSSALRKALFAGTGSESRGAKPASAPSLPVDDQDGASSASLGECPVDRDELGRHTWALLHTMASYFPEQPSDTDREHARSFIRGLAHLYPCSHCAEDFREAVAKSPPRVESRSEFHGWVCEQHNTVNEKLGKPAFPCTPETLAERWRLGGAHCNFVAEEQDEL